MVRAAILTVAVSLAINASAIARHQTTPFGSPSPTGARSTPGVVPPRDNTAPKTGTSVIRGRVLAADTGAPLRRAQVRIFNGELRENRGTSSDAQGRYEIKELPAGRYALDVSKDGYVGLSYGQTRAYEPGKPLDLNGDEVLQNVDFRLPRGGVITGRVVDEFGEPVARASVTSRRFRSFGGRRRLQSVGGGQTNDLGEFRLVSLPPGQYYVAASADLTSEFIESDSRHRLAPTYYPDTPNPAEAFCITLGVGEEVSNVNITLASVRAARITGTAVDSDGWPMQDGIVFLIGRDLGLTGTGSPIGPDGSFALTYVAPGEYTIKAQMSGPAATGEIATTTLTVNHEDVSGLLLAAQKPAIIRGTIVFDRAGTPPIAVESLHLWTFPATPTPDYWLFAFSSNPSITDDGAFEVKARPGPTNLRVTLPSGRYLKAVRLNGADVTDDGLDLRASQEVSGVEVVITDRASIVSGAVFGEKNQPVQDYAVVIFARHPERWTPESRRSGYSRPDRAGRFQVKGLPAGEYLAIALDYVEQGTETNPDFLDSVRDRATRFSLSDGETRTLDLKLRRAP